MAGPIIFSTKTSAEKRRKSLTAATGYASTKYTDSIMNMEFGIKKSGWVLTSVIPGKPKKYVGATKAGKVTKIVKGKAF